MELVIGDKSSPNFEENEMDIIIIRNSFHHFKKKDKMLKSISSALKSNGILYIKDPVKELDTDGAMCHQAMYKQALVDVVTKNGFKMEAEVFWGDQYLWKFIKQ